MATRSCAAVADILGDQAVGDVGAVAALSTKPKRCCGGRFRLPPAEDSGGKDWTDASIDGVFVEIGVEMVDEKYGDASADV